MPRRDGTGPLGKGSRGRGRGCRKIGLNTNPYCNENIGSNLKSLKTQAVITLHSLTSKTSTEKSGSQETGGTPGTFIITDACRGCDACRRVCPTKAISGNLKKQHHIDPIKCIKCGSCMTSCPFNAIKQS